LFSSDGKFVYGKETYSTKSHIDMSSLVFGVYILNVQTKNTIQTKKVIKQ